MPDSNLKPRDLLCLNLIKCPSKIGLTPETTFQYFLLAIDGYSWLCKITGLFSTQTENILQALVYIQIQFFSSNHDTMMNLTMQIQANIYIRKFFVDFCRNHQITMTLAASKHLEMNLLLERT